MFRRIALLAFMIQWTTVFSQTEGNKGLEIAREADRRDSGWLDSTAEVTMILRSSHGEESYRYLHNSTLEVKHDGDKTLVVFEKPRDLKGTAFLAYSHKVEPDDQWLYMPSLKRVKRISSSNKSGSFMGSEFAFEDISSQEVEKYTYKYLKEETIQGIDFFVIERYPIDKKSGYTRQVVWYDKQHYRPFKIDYYDRKDALLKTLECRGYQKYLDKYWRAAEFFMQNHQTAKSTRILFKNYRFKVGLKSRDFNSNSLKRAR